VTDRWHHYISGAIDDAGGPLAAAYQTWTYMAPVLDRIRVRLPPGSRILELGCGAGFHAVLLAAWGYEVTGIDSDPRIVDVATRTAATLGDSGVSFRVADATALPEDLSGFDLAFSLGLIEHFDRGVAAGMLRGQARAAHRVMAVIPTRHLHHVVAPTDERFYSASELSSLFRDAGLWPDEVFAFGDIPTTAGRWTRRLLPHAAYRLAQVRLGYAMDLCVFASRARRPSAG
jgi:SAM-dependent methyltransferase